MTLVPNKPINRLAHVIKTYGASKSAVVLTPTIRIALLTMGHDTYIQYFNEHFAQLQTMWVFASRGQRHSLQAKEEGRLLTWLSGLLSAHHPRDHVIPWVARELSRLFKAVQKNQGTMRDYENAVSALERQSTVIAMWAEANRIDLTKTTLAEALEAVKDFEVEGAAAPQGEVVYEFADGYTIQRLQGQPELEAEGEIMQHCVGGYCEQVQAGEVVIFSLRDPKGQPHATIEWRPDYPSTWDSVGLRPEAEGRFVQIRGKQNEMPAEKYRPYIQTFIRERFYADPLGLLMVVMPRQTITFAEYRLEDVDFSEDWAWGDVPLNQADFSKAVFVECQFRSMFDVTFDGATFERCKIDNIEAKDCRFVGATFSDCYFDYVTFERCDFVGARFDDTVLDYGTTLYRCDCRDTVWDNNSRWKRVVTEQSDFQHAKFKHGTWGDVVIIGGVWDTAVFEDWDIYTVQLQEVDFSRALRATVERIYEAEPRVGSGVRWPDWLKDQRFLEEVGHDE